VLSSEERREIENAMGHYPDKRAACIEALQIVQRHRGGWVPDEGIADAAALLGMTADELDSIATFYNAIHRRPVGRHVILVCDSVSCWIMGCERLRQDLRERLGVDYGETTADGRFTLLPNVCLGACDRAPAIMIDEDLHPDVAAGGIGTILAGYR
jgi:NADH-quinone oxidoreductase subunit E